MSAVPPGILRAEPPVTWSISMMDFDRLGAGALITRHFDRFLVTFWAG
ncbi:hypothetical protein L248_3128 [Schleiferilactobacillus shenzhenensis LY-73]|uniref:Uncharacterized protein n=1 Tax=Schleiferilactobacillus shenzhenensis LY-73 TaxID=1231336 RepID=U4TJG6_9LACO|nr:hypothetical protein L248_3128 [Schleiferilactobacillus shenzhenensis LY-73]